MTLPDTLFADLDLDLDVRRDAPLAPRTWYAVGGHAQALVTPADAHALATLLQRCRDSSVPVRILGSGANLLVADAGVPGVVITLDHPAFRQQHIEPDTGRLRVGAGSDLMALVNETVRHGLAGLEVLTGVPASLGGAIRMNAGGAYGEIADAILDVTLMDHDGNTATRQRADIDFRYRHSGLEQTIITDATLQLTPGNPDDLRQRLKDIFATKKAQQPFAAKSAGCAFKNPVDDHGRPNDAAGRIIDQCGLKGHRLGGAAVSERHANFITADPNATADDIINLIRRVQDEVERQTGIRLVREVVVWP
ncbi:UDP-N-acetylmuramate dehydrogenase [Mucisphaera calidilacus]|uniref:UDP-N-acetylenolpyruvoylglucosamine reductase n=1 Tax=Mucisphaera calidilacus TaxID=2527982 RepID=A0A518BTI9_9BACT|nr:UDP-N-acetylmuramate dehydrogenase [Mucisphaera calidilacus]QDU70291.1 UDP-N-acetylenolpyruvoylglucosamine reductase MurB [Mucisphaera calidilacus]